MKRLHPGCSMNYKQYYLYDEEEDVPRGPVELEMLRQMASVGVLKPEHYVVVILLAVGINPLSLVLGFSFMVLFSVGITWVMFGVMGRY